MQIGISVLKVFIIEIIWCGFFEFLVEQQTFPGDLPALLSMVRTEDREMGSHYLLVLGASSWRQGLDANVHPFRDTVTIIAVTAITAIYWLGQRKKSDL